MPRSITAFLALFLCVGCASTPVGFAGGVRWTVPLVSPLENGQILLPVNIHGKGPYLFIVDPDAARSMIDREVAQQLDLYSKSYAWHNFLDQNDHVVRGRKYEVLDLKTGDLRIRHVNMFSVPAGSLRVGNRRVHGVLGGDLLSRTIVLDVDRDQGVLRLALTGHEVRPARKAIKGYTSKYNGPFRKLVVPVTLANGTTIELAVDLAAKTSAVRKDLITRAGMPLVEHREEIIDEYGTRQVVNGLSIAPSLRVNGVTSKHVAVIPFSDKRVRDVAFDGVLGQNLLSRYRVVFQPDRRELWLLPRAVDLQSHTSARLARWGNAFSGCLDPGCVTVQYDAETGLRVRRARGAPTTGFAVLLQALNAQGQPLGAPLIRVAMASQEVVAAADKFRQKFAGVAGFRIVDASPHATACSAGDCVTVIGHKPLTTAASLAAAGRR